MHLQHSFAKVLNLRRYRVVRTIDWLLQWCTKNILTWLIISNFWGYTDRCLSWLYCCPIWTLTAGLDCLVFFECSFAWMAWLFHKIRQSFLVVLPQRVQVCSGWWEDVRVDQLDRRRQGIDFSPDGFISRGWP